MRNKANFARAEIGAKPSVGKELCRMYLSHQLGKTKPILTAMPIRRSAFPGAKRAKQSQFPAVQGGSRPGGREAWRAIVQNEANLAPVSGNGRAPASPGASAEGRLCKTKPIFKGLIMEITSLQKSGYGGFTQSCGREKRTQFASEADGTFRLRTAGQDLQYGKPPGIVLVRTSHGERELLNG